MDYKILNLYLLQVNFIVASKFASKIVRHAIYLDYKSDKKSYFQKILYHSMKSFQI